MPSSSISRLIKGVARKNCRSMVPELTPGRMPRDERKVLLRRLARDRGESIRVCEILKPNRSVEFLETTPVLCDFRRHARCIELDGAPMRKRVAGDLVSPTVKGNDLIGLDPVPVLRALADPAASDVKGGASAIFLQQRCAHGRRTPGNVVEGEAHHRRFTGQSKRRAPEMPGEPVGNARFEPRQRRAPAMGHLRDLACCLARASSPRKASQLAKITLAAAPGAISWRSVRPGSSAASSGSRSVRARLSKFLSCSIVAASK